MCMTVLPAPQYGLSGGFAKSFCMQIMFYFLLDHWAYCGIFENAVLLIYTLKGISSVANFITSMKSLSKTETSIF